MCLGKALTLLARVGDANKAFREGALPHFFSFTHVHHKFRLCAADEYSRILNNYGKAKSDLSQARRQLTDDDKKNIALEYLTLIHRQARGKGTYGRVKALCNRWGVSRNYVAKILKKGTTEDGKVSLNRKIRQFTGVKIMDQRENHQAVIDIMKERTDGVSQMQLLRAFNKRTGQSKCISAIQRKLTSMSAKKHKPTFRPKLKREHKVARKIFATSMLDNRY